MVRNGRRHGWWPEPLLVQNAYVIDDIPELDLDVGASDVPARPRAMRGPVMPLWALVSLVIGAVVLTASLTRSWDNHRAAQTRRHALAAIVNISPDADLILGHQGKSVTVSSGIQVTNVGPLPIRLRTVAATSEGFRLRGDAGNVVVAAEHAQSVVVFLAIDCRTWRNADPIAVRVAARTVAGTDQSIVKKVEISGTIWDHALCTAQ
jgi:hypothetical protein